MRVLLSARTLRHPTVRNFAAAIGKPTAEALAARLTAHCWTLCTGFEYAGLLFLNDAVGEDGAQEYAVIQDGRQIESITLVRRASTV
jgi:hypothetical protein